MPDDDIRNRLQNICLRAFRLSQEGDAATWPRDEALWNHLIVESSNVLPFAIDPHLFDAVAQLRQAAMVAPVQTRSRRLAVASARLAGGITA